jgi:hypothetical protein
MTPIYYLWDYDWELGELLSTGAKNYRVRMRWQNSTRDRYFPRDRCAFPGELVCVVWEMWRGKNGRGAYRVEREQYPQHRVPAEMVARQQGVGRVTERNLGELE